VAASQTESDDDKVIAIPRVHPCILRILNLLEDWIINPMLDQLDDTRWRLLGKRQGKKENGTCMHENSNRR
jgi:hypothetical protein